MTLKELYRYYLNTGDDEAAREIAYVIARKGDEDGRTQDADGCL